MLCHSRIYGFTVLIKNLYTVEDLISSIPETDSVIAFSQSYPPNMQNMIILKSLAVSDLI